MPTAATLSGKLPIDKALSGGGLGNAQDRWVEATKRPRGPLADKVCRRLVMASPILAAHLLLEGPKRAPFNGRFLYGQVHLQWDRILTTERRFAVMAPRGIGKSEVFSFAYPVWQMVRNVLPQGLLIASTFDNAQRVLQKIRDEIEANPLLRWLYPTNARHSRQWNNKQITLSNGHQLLARSCLSRIRGLHPSYIIGDDILSDEAKISEIYRRKVADFFFSILENMPTADGQLGICGTPMHSADLLYHDLKVNPEYVHHSFPILDSHGRSLWPEMFPVDYIERQKRVIGSMRFTTEMMVKPVTDETSLIPRSLMAGEPQEQFTMRLGMALEELAGYGLAFFMGVDLAFSASAKADYFVICVIGVDAQENHWVIDMVRRQGVPYHEQFSLINTLGRRYNCRRINVEANQAQSILGSELIRNTNLPVKKYVTTAKKHDLATGLPSLRRMAEHQKWRIPRGDTETVERTDVLLDELASFTFIKGKVVSVGAHDDTALALYLATEAARAGRSFHFGQGPKVSGPKPLPGIAGLPVGPESRPAGNFGPSSRATEPQWRR